MPDQSRIFTVIIIFLLTAIIALPIIHDLAVTLAFTTQPDSPLSIPANTAANKKMTTPIVDQPTRLKMARTDQELPSYAQTDNHGETMQKEFAHDTAIFPTRIVPTNLPDAQ